MTGSGVVWSVVFPVKRLELAKSRLVVDAGLRPRLALAMATDTVRAALACAVVGEAVVVTDDPVAAAAMTGLGARVVPDRPDAGLNPALRHGAAAARLRAVAAMSCDLPALRPEDLTVLLTEAAAHPRAVVADAGGTGTTLLSARRGADLRPGFGPQSFAVHLREGAVDVTAAAGMSVRRDVDTVEDLRAAADLGVGPATAGIVAATAHLG